MTGRRVLLFITIFLFISFKSFSAVFTVTSNADSGPGTLREALTLAAANGSAEKDYIYFNLPDLSEAGRTITLFTQLPDVSSNLVIDGTTQPGVKFGMSDAKVGLFYRTAVEQYLQGLKISQQHDITILGLYLNNLTDVSGASMFYDWSAFFIENSNNITIGEAGKGNVANNFFNPLRTYALQDNTEHIENLVIKSNFFGIAPDGVTLAPLKINLVGISNVLGAVTIGGSQAERNIFATGLAFGEGNGGVINPAAIINIKFNNIGVDYSSQVSTHSAFGLMLSSSDNNDNYTYNVEDNILSSKTYPPLDITSPGKRVVILRNYIGIDRTKSHPLEVGPLGGISIFQDHGIMLIGSNNPADANVIAYCKPLRITTSGQVSFNKNSFFCTHDIYPVYFESDYQPLTVANITHLTASNITGTATPNSVVELFYTDDCNTCSPKTYFASANTDNNGNWAYNGLVKGSVIASATFNGSTSEFTKPYLFLNVDDSEVIKNPANCGQSDGSIKNIKLYDLANTNNTYSYSWTNESGIEVGHDLDLTGVPSGTYTLEVKGSGCGSAFSKPIQLQSLTINLDLSNLKTTNPGCNGSTGSITGITASNGTHYQWINKINNQIASNSSDLRDVGPGTYQLTASNDFGCSEKSIEYTINTTQPTTYPVYPFSITNSCSGQNSGSITLTTDPLVKTMRWIDGNGQPAGTDVNPHGLKPGTYKVYFTDANGCETLYPHDFTVNEIDPLQIVANSETRTDDQCGLNTGSIKNIQVKGGTQPYTYLWLNVAGEHLFTSQDLTDVGAGDYTLQVQDASGCGVMASRIYTVLNENSSIDAPIIAPLQLCAPGEALLSVSSPSAGNTYRLYDSQTSTQYQDEQTNGIFKIKANPNSTYYISRVSGQCESERTQAQITISLSAIDIPNAFTPNGDGKNDYWKINNAQNYPQAIVQVFTRYGQKVFESKGYSVPFDGTYNGTRLPSGVYYYILNLGKSCNLLSGSLSIIR
ncbi:gliding motility-associated C-terminal domain-containing protein [Mucilaginibacter sp. R-33]|uniref:T9SS type B sorting domain-containing protein n=1 Tax=Mucilaginibacter sp. R-33 TaxID=3416711 RepID=UPI003CF4B316